MCIRDRDCTARQPAYAMTLQAGGTYHQICRADGQIEPNWKQELPPHFRPSSVKTTGDGWQHRLVDEMGERHSAMNSFNASLAEDSFQREIKEWDCKRPSYLPVHSTSAAGLRGLEQDLASEAFLRSKFGY
eukprot:TRINITY_DN4369_c0_g1_i3.p1 TRINITY_DN4369_c0_g1~~TRINITY_DN4369_c0_g1_i3.p1  ORF type:complete len:131 (+),score=42.02 TRINITY_DN4369_c0_g1_i3:143-535(+)